MRTSFWLFQPEMCSFPLPLTPQTATRTVSLGPPGFVSPSPSSPPATAFLPGIAAMAAANFAVSAKNSRRGSERMGGTLVGIGAGGGAFIRSNHLTPLASQPSSQHFVQPPLVVGKHQEVVDVTNLGQTKPVGEE